MPGARHPAPAYEYPLSLPLICSQNTAAPIPPCWECRRRRRVGLEFEGGPCVHRPRAGRIRRHARLGKLRRISVRLCPPANRRLVDFPPLDRSAHRQCVFHHLIQFQFDSSNGCFCPSNSTSPSIDEHTMIFICLNSALSQARCVWLRRKAKMSGPYAFDFVGKYGCFRYRLKMAYSSNEIMPLPQL